MHATLVHHDSSDEGRLHPGRGKEYSGHDPLVMYAGCLHAEAQEQLAHSFTPGAQLHRAVVHLLPRNATDELAQHSFVRIEQAVIDIVASVDPTGLNMRQPSIAKQVSCQLS